MSTVIERFLGHYYSRRPVNATFTGMHDYDRELPDWSSSGLGTLRGEMRALHAELAGGPSLDAPARIPGSGPDAMDRELASSYLDTQLVELDSGHGPSGNPALWTGEAVFGVISLMIRDFAPVDDRRERAVARLLSVPVFLQAARTVFGEQSIPAAWLVRAARDCEGACVLLEQGMPCWISCEQGSADVAVRLVAAAAQARAAFAAFATWLADRARASDDHLSCGAVMYETLLSRGHHCSTPPNVLLREARTSFVEARAILVERARLAGGSWTDVSEGLAADHPDSGDYLDTFARTWKACRTRVAELDLVEWPDWPIRYQPYPAWTAAAAPLLYYLHYRSPAPGDPYSVYDYVVPAVPPIDARTHLRTWNRSVIKLNHVVHHGALGHHVQNWHAYHRAASPLARIGAVDCANRIGMFGAGTMAEGWACYATDLMDEADFLTLPERAAEQHSRVRQLARAIVDISLHTERMSPAAAVALYRDDVGMSEAAANAEVARNTMFPGVAVMYWLGTREIHAWREDERRVRGSAFSLRRFHDRLLAQGSVPVALARRFVETTVAA